MTLDTVRKTFTDWAPVYDATHSWSLPLRRTARLALGARPGERILDLGCGTGLNFPHLSKLIGKEGLVIGADLTPAMLDIARRRIAQHAWENVEAREADAAHLPFADASFDRAICSYSLNIIPDYVRGVEEVKRVLAPGGRFVSLEMQSSLHALPGFLQYLPHICGVDMSHQTLDEMRRAFGEVQVHHYWLGLMFIAVATREPAPLA